MFARVSVSLYICPSPVKHAWGAHLWKFMILPLLPPAPHTYAYRLLIWISLHIKSERSDNPDTYSRDLQHNATWYFAAALSESAPFILYDMYVVMCFIRDAAHSWLIK